MSNEIVQPDPDIYERIATLCTNANLRNASRAITQLYDAFLEPSGLLGTQFRLLGAIASSEPVALTPLADMLGVDPTTLARNLKPLERDGLIETSIGEEDRRTRVVTITKAGKSALFQAIPLWETAQAWIIEQLGEERWKGMLADWTELASLANKR
jgi:DNA-binding MarR family transcriptional regulator